MRNFVVITCLLCAALDQIDITDAKRPKAIRCTLPKPPMFGSVRLDEKRNRIIYECDKGFKLIRARRRQQCIRKKVSGMTYYDWNGGRPECVVEGYSVRKCPRLDNPKNGTVIVSNYSRDGKASYKCDKHYKLIGNKELTCTGSRRYRWDKEYPTCQDQSVEGFSRQLEDKFISKFASSSADSRDGIQEKLSVGKSGLDIVFAVDVSSSIGPNSFNKTKEFIKIVCRKFGVSKDPLGGENGTRIALITFSSTAKVIFNLADKKIRSIEKVIEKVDGIQQEGGGTNFRSLLTAVRSYIYLRNFGRRIALRNEKVKKRKEGANRALFIFTDAEITTDKGHEDIARARIASVAKVIQKDDKFEIFAIGVGKVIKNSLLAKIASEPDSEHLFQIDTFEDLDRIGKIVFEELDYGKCGISGNTEIQRDWKTEQGALPWLGWITSVLFTGEIITCGGVLLCDKWFVTLASCVTDQTEDGLRTLEGRINLYLGDHDIWKIENTEIMLEINKVYIHGNYTGEVNRHNVRPFDIALLEIGQDNTTRPNLNRYIRPICFLEKRNEINYNSGLSFLSGLKKRTEEKKGRVAGWGHRGREKIISTDHFPLQKLRQVKREVKTDEICRRKFTGLDTDMFFCVGNIYEPESERCYGDIGGPLMGVPVQQVYAVLGLALKTKGCTDRYDFSIFLNVFHPEINGWLQRKLRGCNRIGDYVPYVEKDKDNSNETDTDYVNDEKDEETLL